MSLADFAIRQCTMFALRDKTLAGPNVYDSPIDPLLTSLGDSVDAVPRTILAIYNSLSETDPAGNSDLLGTSWSEMTIQIYVPWASGIKAATELGEIKGRESGGSLLQDMISRQINRVFTVDMNPWSVLRRKFIFQNQVRRSQSFVLATDAKTLEVSCREIVFRYEPISDAAFTGEVGEQWLEFSTLLQGEGLEGAALANIVDAMTSGDTTPEAWQLAMHDLGISELSAKALGIGPALSLPPTEDSLAILERIVITDRVMVPDE